MNRTIFSVLVLIAAFTGVLCETACGSNTCMDGQSCCQDVVLGPTCYDSDGYSCPLGSQGNILCGFQEHGADFACNIWCYDNVDYVCCNETVYNRNAADIPWDMCINNGDGTDSPSTAAPSTSAPSTAAPSTAAPSTASPSTAAPSTASPSTAAPVFMCGNDACETGLCCNDVRLGAICYDSSTFSCPLGSQGNILCGFQENGADFACGLTCYDNVTYICCNDVVYGRNATGVPCLNNTSGSVNGGGETSGSIIITTNITSSEEDTGDHFGVACGDTHCQTNEACCATTQSGPACFLTSSNSCVNGDFGSVICGVAEQVCNMTCFNPSNFFCSVDSTILHSASSSQFANMNYVFGLVFSVMAVVWLF